MKKELDLTSRTNDRFSRNEIPFHTNRLRGRAAERLAIECDQYGLSYATTSTVVGVISFAL